MIYVIKIVFFACVFSEQVTEFLSIRNRWGFSTTLLKVVAQKKYSFDFYDTERQEGMSFKQNLATNISNMKTKMQLADERLR